MLEAILNFPIPKTLTHARSWFGLVNQVAWAYSLGPVMLPFRDLVKRDSHFTWDQGLEGAFQHSKQVIVDLVRNGIATFEKDRITCLAPRLAVSTNSIGSIPCGGGETYLACADRLTGWLIIHHLNQGQANASSLISICRDIFQTYGAPEELSSDGGPPFKSSTFTQFLKDWAVKHRLSSAAYPQSNGRAELAVKTAKRIIIGNTGPQGSLDNDRAARAVLQYRNTPIQNIGLSPAQLLLHRRLRDFVPSHPTLYKPHAEWITAARNREKSLSQRNARLIEKYNRTAHTLRPLLKGQIVSIQCTNNNRWNTTGQIIETLPHNQYRIRVDGSGRITLRNRRFPQETQNPVNPTSNSKSFQWNTNTRKGWWKQNTGTANHRQWKCTTATPATEQYQPAKGDNAGQTCSSFIPVCSHTTNRDWKNLSPPKDHCPWGEGEI